MNIIEKYKLWCEQVNDTELKKELESIASDEEAIKDRFFKDLEFGTGGLRGIIGAGTNRMNVYTVGKATQGLADYINSITKNGSAAIAYDSRINSRLFAETTASVLAANGIKVFIYSELMPTPMLSFAVRRLGCDAGIVITASHNPSIYNGYKVYGPDGCQLTLEASAKVLELINKVDTFRGIKRINFDDGLKDGTIQYIEQWVIDDYLENVYKQSINPEICKNSSLKVIYTPLHGSGNKPVRAILDKIGIKNVTVVKEQEQPDGNFPTAPYPNPEIKQPFELALDLAKTQDADLLLATDPDCDRVGIAVKSGEGYTFMTGNEVGALLLDYVLSQRSQKGTLPKNPIAVKTIVSTEICNSIAKKYGCEIIDVLTGFKFIGEQISLLESRGESNRFVFGFEESYGYLAGNYVRDKDGVVTSMLICEMACFYKSQGKTLIDRMEELYKEHGNFLNRQKSYTCEGVSGMQRMENIMKSLSENPPLEIGPFKVTEISNYQTSEKKILATLQVEKITLPKSKVLAFRLEGDASVIIRPSGTEPKIKVYISCKSENKEQAIKIADTLENAISRIMGF
ncbi:MAG TPA: phospho-sugar mutase [Clostridiales bacterium]|nr:phospho-sugar mutase [Clostridiales bacterium]